MSTDTIYTFSLTPQQVIRFEEWVKQFDSIPCGPCGGSITFCFTPTSIGLALTAKHFQGQELDLTEYDEW